MATQTNPMKALYGRLSELGLSRNYVRQTVLPRWWDDDAAATPAGFAEATMLISRHLGLELSDLRADTGSPELGGRIQCKFKKAPGSTESDVALARSLATQVAVLASAAVTLPPVRIPSAAEVRAALLDRGDPWVGLETLVDYCWSVGVPVLHVSNFPRGARKPDGLAANIGGRPVILICKEQKQPAWILFILAHELGHIALGHIGAEQVLVDEKVEEDNPDTEEKAANAYAVELLAGDARRRFQASGRWPNARGLAEEAKRLGRQLHVDPGHLALNYAKSMGPTFFSVANAALAHIEPTPDAVGLLRRKLAENLDWSSLAEDAAEFVTRLTGLDDAPLTP